jgi:dienelactone hydrolase
MGRAGVLVAIFLGMPDMRTLTAVCCGLLIAASVPSGANGLDPLQAKIRQSDRILAPQRAGPHPAVIMLHGCAGLGTRDQAWAERLREWGYLTLRVDSFKARGLKRVCGGGILESHERVPDVLAALAYLRTRPEVRKDRIAVMGWSHGAGAALAALAAAPAEPERGFRAAVAYYPGCRQLKPWSARTPTLLLLGEADDWTAAGPCQALAARQAQAGLDVTQVTYPGAYHAFDNPLLGSEKRRAPDARGGRGATLQYNPAAAEDSFIRARTFLAQHLGLSWSE